MSDPQSPGDDLPQSAPSIPAPDVRTALRALLDWGREHTSPRDPNSPHDLLVQAAAALEASPGGATLDFVPKAGGPRWTVDLTRDRGEHSRHDLALMLDLAYPTETSGWMIELSIDPVEEEGWRVSGKITSSPGYDAIVSFASEPDMLLVVSNASHEDHVAFDEKGLSFIHFGHPLRRGGA